MPRYLVYAIAVLPTFVGHVASTAAAVAFPSMVAYFDTSLVLAGWVLIIYQLVTIGAIPVVAKLSDTVGRRSTLMGCLALFSSGSLLCAVAPNMGWLIAARALQGIGGGGFVAASIGIVSEEFPGMRQRLIALTVSIATIGSMVGPSLGGVMVEYLGWQSIFWLDFSMGTLSIVLGKFYIRPDVKRASHGELDFLGIGLLTGFVSGATIGFTLTSPVYRAPPVLIIAVALLGVLCLAVFVYRAWSGQGKVFSWPMLASRPFLAANLYNLAYGACGENGILTLMPLYATSVYGMSVLQAGLIITPRSLGVMLTSVVAAFSIMRWGYRKPILLGTLVTVAAIFLLAIEPGSTAPPGEGISPFIIVMSLSLLGGIGGGLVNPASNNACIDLMPDKAASITGLRQIFRRIGQTISIAAATVVLESSSDMAQGFTMVMLVFGGILLLGIIAIFFMPAGPKCK